MILVWILLIAWGIWLLLPRITRWLMGALGRRMQRQMFRNMGIDPSAYERQRRGTASSRRQADNGRRTSHTRTRSHSPRRSKIIPAGYGEYVSFTELTLTGTEAWLDGSASPVFVEYNERQITDIRWEEIK